MLQITLIFELLLDLISVAVLVVYIIAEKRYLPTVQFELLFAVMGMALTVLSYLHHSLIPLSISSIVFLLAVIRIVRVTKVIEKWKKK